MQYTLKIKMFYCNSVLQGNAVKISMKLKKIMPRDVSVKTLNICNIFNNLSKHNNTLGFRFRAASSEFHQFSGPIYLTINHYIFPPNHHHSLEKNTKRCLYRSISLVLLYSLWHFTNFVVYSENNLVLTCIKNIT